MNELSGQPNSSTSSLSASGLFPLQTVLLMAAAVVFPEHKSD